MRVIGQRVDQWLDQRVDPRPVAALRIALGVAVVSNTLEVSVVLQRIVDGGFRVPVVDWMPAPTALAVQVSAVLGVLAGLALALGLRASAAAVVVTVLNVWVFLWDQQTYSNHRVLATLMVAFLVFAQSDARWALRRRELPTVRWWPQVLIMTQVSVCYLFAGLNKVNPVFLEGDLFASWMRWPLPEQLYPVLALTTVLTEVFLAVGLWWRRTRPLAVLAGVGLHVSIVVTMTQQTVPLAVFGLTCIATYWLYFTRPSPVPAPLPEGRSDWARPSTGPDRGIASTR